MFPSFESRPTNLKIDKGNSLIVLVIASPIARDVQMSTDT